MSHYYTYKKNRKRYIRKASRVMGILLILLGSVGLLYIFFPLVSWQVYFAPVFAAQQIEAPIPKSTVITSGTMKSLLVAQARSLSGVDYTNVKNWFSSPHQVESGQPAKVPSYTLAVPTLGIKQAFVSTVDYDVGSHLVHYGGTSLPGENGTAVVFGHSTLPQLFDPTNYKAIFATAYKLKTGDILTAEVSGVVFTYEVYSVTVVDPDDPAILAQNFDNAYLTIVTCTPPGTTWKRLLIHSRLKHLQG